MQIAVLDYGSGNIRSAQRALQTTGADVVVTADFAVAAKADGLVVPGVGAFAACMASLEQVRAAQLVDQRLASGRPVLGICVGMQVLFEWGDEHGVRTAGLGQWPGVVSELKAPILPHMGWNTIDAAQDSKMFAGIGQERFYFVHSYAAHTLTWNDSGPLPPPKVSFADYGTRFIAAIENGPLWATQFHPEKSGTAGLRLLANWVCAIGDS